MAFAPFCRFFYRGLVRMTTKPGGTDPQLVNYYEELGLTPQSSTEEIRRSYRNLSRILHPDQQTDDNLSRLAGNQMKRLNAIHDLLTDPFNRRQYDLSLAADSVEERSLTCVTIRLPFWANGNLLFWGLIALLGAGSVFWSLQTPPAPNPPPVQMVATQQKPGRVRLESRKPQPERRMAAGQISPAKRTADSGKPLQTVQPEKEIAPPDPFDIPQPSIPASLSPIAAIQPPEPIKPAAPVEPLRAGGPCPFAGTWFWARPKNLPPPDALYPPDYIEMAVAEEGGILEGRYRARYRVYDRPISSQVLFRFAGKFSGDTAVLNWTGAGGAKGEVHLRLLTPDSMEVKWTATELGSQMDLASGTAALIRRQDP